VHVLKKQSIEISIDFYGSKSGLVQADYSLGLLKRAQKFGEISHLSWILLRKRQINWEILSNFCSPVRKPELYSRSYNWNQNFFSFKLLKLIGLCTVRQISIIQAFTDSNWQPPKCYRMSKIFFVPVPIWSSSCNPSDTIFRILAHAKKK
jgi:hypothetical protein